MLKKLTILAVTAAWLLPLDAALAGNIRCGGHLISDGGRNGPGKYEVLKKCGEPTARLGNTWVYERGGKKSVISFNDSGLFAQFAAAVA